MTKQEILEWAKNETLFSSNCLFVSTDKGREEIIEWQGDIFWLVWNRVDRDPCEANCSLLLRIVEDAVETLVSVLARVSLCRSISHFENDTHCIIHTCDLDENGQTNIDADVLDALSENMRRATEEIIARAKKKQNGK